DYKDLEFGLKHCIDLVALSFVRSADDVKYAKRLIGERTGDVQLIAKLEKPQAVEDLEGILEAADGVMVARGDLGVEMPPEKVPVIQKHIIRRASEWRNLCFQSDEAGSMRYQCQRPSANLSRMLRKIWKCARLPYSRKVATQHA